MSVSSSTGVAVSHAGTSHTEWLMRSSAAFLAVVGLVATFAPQEIVSGLGGNAHGPMVLLVQVLGAQSLGLAMLNWTARANLIGGIYSRPVAVANVVTFSIAAIALGKAVFAGPFSGGVLAVAAVLIVFAALYTRVLMTHPLKAVAP